MADADRWLVTMKRVRVRLSNGRVMTLEPRAHPPDQAESLRSILPKRALEHLRHDGVVREE